MGARRKGAAILTAGALALVPAVAVTAEAGFEAHVSRIPPRLKERMTGKSWHKGCPVAIRRLRLIEVSYRGFDKQRHMGRLVAHRDAVTALVSALRSMYRHGFKIRKMYLVDRYDASDRRSMRADNTSAFNCRKVAGTNRWSEHAYGRAIDVNPVENPYVASDGTVTPRKGAEYADRTPRRKGMIASGGATVRAFERVGWGWGGYWSSAKDYQHFSASGS
ncbi:MAG: M15 family metallopeptidase [Actinomycetota bacterium]